MGVPVNPMKVALGRAALMFADRLLYWLLWASSVNTMTLDLFVKTSTSFVKKRLVLAASSSNTGSSSVSDWNFWMVVHIIFAWAIPRRSFISWTVSALVSILSRLFLPAEYSLGKTPLKVLYI